MIKPAQPDGTRKLTRIHGLTWLVMLGIVILAALTLRSLVALVAHIVTLIRGAAQWTGNFWSDQFPIIALAAIVGLGAFGMHKLVRSLRK